MKLLPRIGDFLRRARFGACVQIVCALGATLCGGCANRNNWFAKTDAAQRLAQEARQAEDRGDLAQAQHLMTAAVKTNPGDCETRLELCDLLIDQGSPEAACDHLKRIITQNPDDPRPMIRLAQAQYLRRDLSAATTLIDKALKLDPGNVDALLLRGQLYEHAQDDDAALAIYYRVLQVNPDRAEPELRVAAIHLRNNRARQADPLLRSVLERPELNVPQKAAAEWLLGLAYAQEHRWADAAQTLATASARREMTPVDWYQLAYARFQAQDFEGAREAADLTLEADPRHSAALAMRHMLNRPSMAGGSTVALPVSDR